MFVSYRILSYVCVCVCVVYCIVVYARMRAMLCMVCISMLCYVCYAMYAMYACMYAYLLLPIFRVSLVSIFFP